MAVLHGRLDLLLGKNYTFSAEGCYKRIRRLPMLYDSDDFLAGDGRFVYAPILLVTK